MPYTHATHATGVKAESKETRHELQYNRDADGAQTLIRRKVETVQFTHESPSSRQQSPEKSWADRVREQQQRHGPPREPPPPPPTSSKAKRQHPTTSSESDATASEDSDVTARRRRPRRRPRGGGRAGEGWSGALHDAASYHVECAVGPRGWSGEQGDERPFL